MSAELLHRAAAAMRARAEKATPGEWWQESGIIHAPAHWPAAEKGSPCHPARTDLGNGADDLADAEHIASWHPGVALVVAEWLDDVSFRAYGIGLPVARDIEIRPAEAIARAYLNEEVPW